MRRMSADLVDPNGPTDWWKTVVQHFVVPGDALEIRCWREQPEVVSQAAQYGAPEEDGYEVFVQGTVSQEFLAELLAEEPVFQDTYHKQTKPKNRPKVEPQIFRIWYSAHELSA